MDWGCANKYIDKAKKTFYNKSTRWLLDKRLPLLNQFKENNRSVWETGGYFFLREFLIFMYKLITPVTAITIWKNASYVINNSPPFGYWGRKLKFYSPRIKEIC